jgi:hypothetical protein
MEWWEYLSKKMAERQKQLEANMREADEDTQLIISGQIKELELWGREVYLMCTKGW